MVDTFDNSLMSMFGAGGGDASSGPDLNPVTGKPNVIPRNDPDLPDRRHRLVSDWTRKVKRAKRFWKPSFDRMREDQEFAFGKQWSKDASDKRYVANLTLRLVAQKTAFLYAKNPKAVAKKRPRLNATSWDESQTTLNQLMQSAAMMMQQAQASGMARPAAAWEACMPLPPELMGCQAASMAQGAIGGMLPTSTGQAPDINLLMSGGMPPNQAMMPLAIDEPDLRRDGRCHGRHHAARHGRRPDPRLDGARRRRRHGRPARRRGVGRRPRRGWCRRPRR
jgi:hypothetical protein